MTEIDAAQLPAFHDAANIFPLMEDSALNELAADISTNGLREPIWRHRDGRIIDGRNRWLACQKVGVTCHAHTYSGDDGSIIPFVISHNLHRRHLTTAQRAAIAADLATLANGQNKAGRPNGLAQSDAAKMLNVGIMSLKRAKAVKDAAPELHEKVKSGEISAGQARAMARSRSTAHQERAGSDARQKGTPGMQATVTREPKLRVVHDRDDGLVDQVFSLLHRLREVSSKTTPEALHARMPARLLHNLDISLEQATEFLIGLRETHSARGAEKKNAAV